MTFLDSVMLWISNWGIIVPIACVLLSRDKKTILRAIIAVVMTFFLTDVLKIVFVRPRPSDVGGGWFLSTPADKWGFPSKHASTSFALATSVVLYKKALGWIAIIFALLISFSRIYLGAHYWSDVIVGAVLGIIIAFATDKAMNYFEKSKKKR